MIADIKGTVTNVVSKTTDAGNDYRVVKVLQMDKQGNGFTVAVRVWDANIIAEVGNELTLRNFSVVAYLNKNKAGLSVDKWSDAVETDETKRG